MKEQTSLNPNANEFQSSQSAAVVQQQQQQPPTPVSGIPTTSESSVAGVAVAGTGYFQEAPRMTESISLMSSSYPGRYTGEEALFQAQAQLAKQARDFAAFTYSSLPYPIASTAEIRQASSQVNCQAVTQAVTQEVSSPAASPAASEVAAGYHADMLMYSNSRLAGAQAASAAAADIKNAAIVTNGGAPGKKPVPYKANSLCHQLNLRNSWQISFKALAKSTVRLVLVVTIL